MTDSTLVCEGHVGSAHASASCMPVLQQCCRPRGAVFSTLRFQTTADRCLLDAGVDRLGVYLYVQRLGQAGEVVRVAFLPDPHGAAGLGAGTQLCAGALLDTTAWAHLQSLHATKLPAYLPSYTLPMCKTQSMSLPDSMAWDQSSGVQIGTALLR